MRKVVAWTWLVLVGGLVLYGMVATSGPLVVAGALAVVGVSVWAACEVTR